MSKPDIAQRSFCNQKYLSVGHLKNGHLVVLPSYFVMYISLFAICTLCRYHPEKWGPFIKNDTTGEKQIVEKLVSCSQRIIPNQILNLIYNRTIYFSGYKQETVNDLKPVSEHEVKEIVEKLVIEELRKREVLNRVVSK